MSNGRREAMRRSVTPSSSSQRHIATLKSLVPPTQRDALRSFFDRRAPVSPDPTASTPTDSKQSWRQWAGDKIRRHGTGSGSSSAVEKVSLFPGWAARAYHSAEKERKGASEFSLEVYVSGFAASYVPPEAATRSQRAFMRLAKAYAALPKLPSSDPQTPTQHAPSFQLDEATEKLLKTVRLPPTPSEITEESELAALEREFRQAELDVDAASLSSADSNSPSSHITPLPSSTTAAEPEVSYAKATPRFSYVPGDLERLHANLSARLQPFWSRALPNRVIRLSLYSTAPRTSAFLPDDGAHDDPSRVPIFVHETVTSAQDGAFEAKIRVPWEQICLHPGALHIAFGDASEEYEIFVCAELLPSNNTASPSASPVPQSSQEPITRSVLAVPVTHSEVRLISDIDDTIKLSNILGGARAVFRNVFVKRLEELVIRGMGEWYTNMWARGVRFHYVSNGPFELLPVINEFIAVSSLPQGSIRLRSYAGRSLFNGFLSAPAMRKRDGIVDVLNSFIGARFILVGDTGEQDLELYAQLAGERHNQILAVFVRDANGPGVGPLDDPTGEKIKHQHIAPKRTVSYASGMPPLPPTHTRGNFARTVSDNEYENMHQPHVDTFGPVVEGSDFPPEYSPIHRPRAQDPPASFSSDPTHGPRTPQTPSNAGSAYDPYLGTTTPPHSSSLSSPSLQFPGSITKAELANLTPSERRRYDLQERVYRARLRMPSHIPLRVFKEPEECVEADRILNEVTGHKR
ncbi:hypothetical protein M0805_001166 [Coniferiporia weirii]|nr:hypothetical protein M0805_001166 [Coniferiporia weirii]